MIKKPEALLRRSRWAVVPLLFLLALLHPLGAGAAEWQLTDGAMVHPEYNKPKPRHSDVILSTRFKRENAVEIIKAYGANRVEWVYSTDKAYVDSITEAVEWFGGTLNSVMTLPDANGLAHDFDGQPLVPPWMRSWGAKLISIAHPAARKLLEDTARRYIDLGASSIQFDDPLLQVQSGYRGGDFSDLVLAEFRKFLTNYPDKHELDRLGITDTTSFDYRQFLTDRFGIRNADEYQQRYRLLPTTPLWMQFHRASVKTYFSEFRATLNNYRGGYFPLSMNLSSISGPNESRPDFFLAEYADYAIVETPIEDIDALQVRAATYRALGIGYVPSILPRSLQENRRAIATLYALGGQPLVPWDVYITVGPEAKPDRFFGAPQDYADLYHFVRKNAHLFDGLEQAAVVGIVVPVDKYRPRETSELVRRLMKYNMPFAFVLTGGIHRKFAIDLALARNYKLLITANAERDYAPGTLQTLATIPVPRISASELSDHAVEALSPFVAKNSSTNLRLYPRNAPWQENPRALVVHVVDSAIHEESGTSSACERTVGIKAGAIPGHGIKAVSWQSGNAVRHPSWIRDGLDFLINIPECVLWGMLRIELS